MRTYEMPEGGAASDGVAEVAEGASAAYSLEEQVRRTSESVERLAEACAALVAAVRGGAL